jgi:hypothetical protein
MIRLFTLAALAAALGGCGLIDSDITRFDLRVSDMTFTVDTAQWELSGDTNGEFPAIDCSQMVGVCSAGISQACGNEALCFGSCDGTNCEALVLVALFQSVNLTQERPELDDIAKQPIIDVHVESIVYSIEENTLSAATPELKLYVAPPSVMNPGDPQAKVVGTIQPVPAGTTLTGRELVADETGRRNLETFMGDYKAEFNVIVGGQVKVSAGDPLPLGSMRASVTVDAYADL